MIKKLKLSEGAETGIFDRRPALLSVMPTVREIITRVKNEGDDALRDYTLQFDSVHLNEIEVSEEEKEAARTRVDSAMKLCIEEALNRIRNFHLRQKRVAWMEKFSDGVYIGELYRPFETIGAYVPAGYFSTALMCISPAEIAGVRDIIVCSPPGKDGNIDPLTLYAAERAGATRIFKVGGAQAIAALAFGTETIPKVEKIVGPGNVYVTAAKMLIREQGVEIDFPAGPSEIMVIADAGANPGFIAADMLAQTEHGSKSRAILLTDSTRIADAVEHEIGTATGPGTGTDTAGAGEESQNWILLASSMEECIEFANTYAPEHLEIMVRNPLEVLKRIKNAGSVFIGDYSPVAAGDYATGANHVLPTAGYASIFSGLDVAHFLHRITVQHLDKTALARLRDVIVQLARAEGMKRHAHSIEVRFQASGSTRITGEQSPK